jgi:hypothetical protein
MSGSRFATVALVTTATAFLALPCRSEVPNKSAEPSLIALSQEVRALEALHAFQITSGQIAGLRTLLPTDVGTASRVAEVEKSAAFRKKLGELREALLEGTNEERIGELGDALDKIRESEKIELQDGFEPTEEAMNNAPEALRLLTPRQVANYVGTIADEIGDPLQCLLDAMDKSRKLKPEEATELGQDAAEEVGRLVAGLDEAKAGRIRDRVIQFLIVVRTLDDAEYKQQRLELQVKATDIIGKLGPTDILRNVTEQALADLLSNPRLPAALEALARAHKKAAKASVSK